MHQIEKPSTTLSNTRRRRVSNGDASTPDSSYMEEVDIDNDGNVISQSVGVSRVQISSSREKSSRSHHDKNSKQQSLGLGKKDTHHFDSSLSRGHDASSASRDRRLLESESNGSIVEYGTLQDINLAYEESTDRAWQGTTADKAQSHSAGRMRQHQAQGRNHEDSSKQRSSVASSSSLRRSGKDAASLSRETMSDIDHPETEAVIPLKEYVEYDTDLLGTDGREDADHSVTSPWKRYDPARYDASGSGLRLSRDSTGQPDRDYHGERSPRSANDTTGYGRPPSALNDTATTTMSATHRSYNSSADARVTHSSSAKYVTGSARGGSRGDAAPSRDHTSSSSSTATVTVQRSDARDIRHGTHAAATSEDTCVTHGTGASVPESVKRTDSTVRRSRDRIVQVAPDGSKVTTYGNGTVKTTYPDGMSEVHFVNGDIKKNNPNDGSVTYYYAHAKTTHITYADETEMYEFPNGQVRSRLPD